MREHGTLMNGEMIRSYSADRKDQTRRPVATLPALPSGNAGSYLAIHDGFARWWDPAIGAGGGWASDRGARCPFGVPGDRLWFRETWGVGTRPCPFHGWRDGIEYRADSDLLEDECDILPLYKVDSPDDVCLDEYYRSGWRPSIHMPRWAARYTPLVKRVWVERVQDITEADAIAEGVESRDEFSDLWDSIYAARGLGWEANPWVWCCEFERRSEASR